jgi:hypothetical protein
MDLDLDAGHDGDDGGGGDVGGNGGGGDELRFPVMENPLLAVLQATWLEMEVTRPPSYGHGARSQLLWWQLWVSADAQ